MERCAPQPRLSENGESCAIQLKFALTGQAFGVILQYLRAERESGLFTVPHLLEDKLARLKAEARFYGLSALHDIIHAGEQFCLRRQDALCNL